VKAPVVVAGILVAITIIPSGCGERPTDSPAEKTVMPPTIEQAVAEASKWADIAGVESVGQGEQDGKPVIRVLVSTPEARRQIPKTFKDFPVIVEQSSPIEVQGGGRR
jgi:hypothetical protein